MSTCPDEEVFVALLEGTLDEQNAQALHQHIDGCESCSRLMIDLARVLTSGSEEALAEDLFISRYKVVRKVGEGGMGVVYEGYDPLLDRRVALKVVRGGDVDARSLDDHSKRLVREAKLLAAISHPNVLPIHDMGEHDGKFFLALEFVDGDTLNGWVEKTAPGWREMVRVYLKAGAGLAAAHAGQLVHRDVKPDNILISEKGDVFITDFGLARSLGPIDHFKIQSSNLTQTGAILGTPIFMSPEQHLGVEVSFKTDIFSFCVALYQSLYRRRPFAGRTREQIALAACSGQISPPPPESEVPAKVYAVIRRGLEPEPDDRYGTMTELISALSATLEETKVKKSMAPWIGFSVLGLLAIFVLWIGKTTPGAVAPKADDEHLRATQAPLSNGSALQGPLPGQARVSALPESFQRVEREGAQNENILLAAVMDSAVRKIFEEKTIKALSPLEEANQLGISLSRHSRDKNFDGCRAIGLRLEALIAQHGEPPIEAQDAWGRAFSATADCIKKTSEAEDCEAAEKYLVMQRLMKHGRSKDPDEIRESVLLNHHRWLGEKYCSPLRGSLDDQFLRVVGALDVYSVKKRAQTLEYADVLNQYLSAKTSPMVDRYRAQTQKALTRASRDLGAFGECSLAHRLMKYALQIQYDHLSAEWIDIQTTLTMAKDLPHCPISSSALDWATARLLVVAQSDVVRERRDRNTCDEIHRSLAGRMESEIDYFERKPLDSASELALLYLARCLAEHQKCSEAQQTLILYHRYKFGASKQVMFHSKRRFNKKFLQVEGDFCFQGRVVWPEEP